MNSRRKSLGLRAAFIVIVVCFMWTASCAVEGQKINHVNYRLRMSRPQSHLFEVTIEVELAGKSSADSVDFQIPRWSPGRYAVFNFSKNIEEFQAKGGACPADKA